MNLTDNDYIDTDYRYGIDADDIDVLYLGAEFDIDLSQTNLDRNIKVTKMAIEGCKHKKRVTYKEVGSAFNMAASRTRQITIKSIRAAKWQLARVNSEDHITKYGSDWRARAAVNSNCQLKVGAWYPCCSDDGKTTVQMWDGESFSLTGDSNNLTSKDKMTFIGRSLGVIKFT